MVFPKILEVREAVYVIPPLFFAEQKIRPQWGHTPLAVLVLTGKAYWKMHVPGLIIDRLKKKRSET